MRASIALLALLFGAAAQAADVRISGMGVRKCAEWENWKQVGNGEARATTLEWAQGFIAGHNVYARAGSNTVPSVVADTKVLVTLLDSYCQKNPDQRILNGVIEINQSLGGAKVNFGAKPAVPETPRPDNNKPRES